MRRLLAIVLGIALAFGLAAPALGAPGGQPFKGHRKAVPTCAQGAVSATCKCGGASVVSGYCCSGVAQAGVCPLLAEDANTLCHVWFDGSTIQRSGCGGAWSNNGTVPQIAAAPPIPAGAGDFNTTPVSYQLGTGADALDFTTDFHVVAIFRGSSSALNRLAGNENGSTVGWEILAANACGLRTYPSGTLVNAGASVAGVPNVLYVGRTGTTLAAKLNFGTYTTATGATIAAGTSQAAYLGMNFSPSGSHYASVLYEILWSSAAPSSAEASSIATDLHTRLGIVAW